MSIIKIKKNKKFITKNRNGKPNGFLIPIINIHDKFLEREQWPKQVYVTVVTPNEVKGPHLHKTRWQLYTCIKGNIKVIVRINKKYEEYYSGEDHEFSTIQVPAGIPSAIENISKEEAYVLNMPSPSWHLDDIDEWDVNFDDYYFSKK